jgi:alpha-amylase
MKKFFARASFLSFASVLALAVFLLAGSLYGKAYAQAGFEDDRVMLQGFYWESYRHGHLEKFKDYGDKLWYDIVNEKAKEIHDGRFDLIWLPPPSFAGQYSAGYNPKEYFTLDNSYGDKTRHRGMLEALLKNGVEPVADIVINHRDGTNGWADFKNPQWGTWAICRDDEVFKKNSGSGFENTPDDQKGAAEENPRYRNYGDYAYPSFRDIDHTNAQVRRDIIKYLFQLQSMGYRGWRYDMVHGYNAKWMAVYNKATHPTFSVGEYDWGAHNEQRGWIWDTSTNPSAQQADHIKTSSSVFDFSTYFTLKDNKGNYTHWSGYGLGLGMIGDNTDGLPWKNRSVTFIENHDTGYRTNDDGSAQDGHKFDSFANGWEVEQAYAYILTHPGVPTVYWKHYFDWGTILQSRIKALINARKVAGVNAGSNINVQNNARSKGVYAAMIEGRNGSLCVRIGGGDNDWQPSYSNYGGYREYAYGDGWKVWVALPGNPDVKQAPTKAALPVPVYKTPDKITVSDDLLDLK